MSGLRPAGCTLRSPRVAGRSLGDQLTSLTVNGAGRWTYLQPQEKSSHLLAYNTGVADSDSVVLVCQGDPIHKPYVHRLGLSGLQCTH